MTKIILTYWELLSFNKTIYNPLNFYFLRNLIKQIKEGESMNNNDWTVGYFIDELKKYPERYKLYFGDLNGIVVYNPKDNFEHYRIPFTLLDNEYIEKVVNKVSKVPRTNVVTKEELAAAIRRNHVFGAEALLHDNNEED